MRMFNISFLPRSSVSDVGQWCNRSVEDCRTLGNWKPVLTLCTSGAVENKNKTIVKTVFLNRKYVNNTLYA